MKNRSALYLTLSGICLILLLAAVNAGELIRLSKTRQSIRYYREALEDVSAIPEQMPQAPGYLPPALPDQMPPPEDPEAEEPGPPAVPAIAEAGAEVRSLLLRHSIRPERLRISGRGTGEAAEFLLRCDPNRFFAFLADTQNKPALRISDISI
ncbi:MAG: hypothetical protein LBQ38_07415, partial [Spirochaetaceae bacterium]|nr:hypothetical protein [Spirochaetaceae bacterium]